METEIWKSHPDIHGIEVSSFGKVRTLDKVASSESGTFFTKGRILKQNEDSGGYLQVSITADRKRTVKRTHRLVAQTFLPNQDNLPEVNHKNCNRGDNRVSNLEWCTPKYNSQYRENYGISRTEISGHSLFSINLATQEVSHFRSQGEAGRELGINQGNVTSVVKGRLKQAGGFWFTNADDKAADAIKRKLQDIKKLN